MREDFLKPAACPDWVPAGDGPLLLVIGGSQGAVGLNRMVRAAAPALLAMGCRIVHLSGHVDPDQGQLEHPAYSERPFSEEIPALLSLYNTFFSLMFLIVIGFHAFKEKNQKTQPSR